MSPGEPRTVLARPFTHPPTPNWPDCCCDDTHRELEAQAKAVRDSTVLWTAGGALVGGPRRRLRGALVFGLTGFALSYAFKSTLGRARLAR